MQRLHKILCIVFLLFCFSQFFIDIVSQIKKYTRWIWDTFMSIENYVKQSIRKNIKW